MSNFPLLRIAAAFALVGLNAFFVLSEFAMVSVRRSWVEAQIEAGHKRAGYILGVIDHLDRYFSALHLAITVASLALGWLGEAAFHELLFPLFERFGVPGALVSAHAASTALAFLFITTMHILFGELIPRAIALQTPERVAMTVVFPLIALQRILSPVANLLNMASRGFLRLFGIQAPTTGHRLYSQEELRILVEQSHAGGVLADAEQRMLTSVFDFAEKKVDSIMTPRTEMVCIPENIPFVELLPFIQEDQHTRLPVYRGTIDQIVGTLNIKHLIPYLQPDRLFTMQAVMREAFFVPTMKPLADLLKEMQHRKEHLAVVVDEFGGTVGLVTMEDMLEEIVGEIFDEFDVEKVGYETLGDGDVVLDGRTNVDRVNELFDLELPEEEYNTLGGLVFGAIGRAPKAGDMVEIAGAKLRVEEVRARRVTKVRLARGKNIGEG
jgi:CBS domain containing-hemolysin-like protein